MDKKDAIKCLKSMQQWIPDWDDREDGLSYWDAIDMAIDALSPPNEPMTLEQLREMDGEPVYIIIDGVDPLKMWTLIEVDGEDIFLTNNLGGRSPYEAVRRLYRFNLYRRPPEEKED